VARAAWLVVALAAVPAAAADPVEKTFRFVGEAPGVVAVPADLTYTKDRGFGFEPGFAPSGDRPVYFSVAVPEGNYRVTVTVGDAAAEADVTVRAELRRLMIERVTAPAGKFETRSFLVNVRTPALPGGGAVKLKDRERTTEAWAWDEKLTLEFNGPKPRLRSVTVASADVPTVFLLGDSTVCDQPREPYASWGQMLPRFFAGTVAVANHAESGETVAGALGAKRVEKVLVAARAGDYLLLQFGHNDMKVVSAEAYAADLKRVVVAARAKKVVPILITPVNRRTFRGTAVTNSLKDFPDAVRALAKAEDVPLIDLHAASKTLYEALGPEKSGALFKPGDGTHHNGYGAYELAKCVVEGIRTAVPDLAKHLAADVKPFDPARPDPADAFKVPPSPLEPGSGK
jgi:lysophospholipase L1-like esterase